MPSNLERIPPHVEICDAVVDLLNDGEFAADFVAERFDHPKTALEAVKTDGTPRLAVLAEAERRKQITRGGAKRIEYDVSVAVVKKVDRAKTTKLDDTDLVRLLASEIVEYLEENALPITSNVRQTDTAVHTACSPELLDQDHLAVAIKTITYVIFSK